MNPIQSFDPIAVPNGTITTHGVNKGEQLLLYNSSLACLQLTFADKTVDILPPSWVRDWIKTSPMSAIQYKTLFTLSLVGQPISQLYGTLYEPTEHVASVNQSLQYVYAVGNMVNTNVAGSSLINTAGPASSTPIIQLANVNFAGNTVFLDNQGNVILGNVNSLGSFKAYGPSTLANSVLIENASTASNETHITNIAGSDIAFYSPAGTATVRIGNNGSMQAKLFEFGIQSGLTLTAMKLISLINLTTSETTYNHNLGVAPDLIILVPNGTSSTVRTYQIDYSQMTTTTFNATGNSSFGAVGVAIKF